MCIRQTSPEHLRSEHANIDGQNSLGSKAYLGKEPKKLRCLKAKAYLTYLGWGWEKAEAFMEKTERDMCSHFTIVLTLPLL